MTSCFKSYKLFISGGEVLSIRKLVGEEPCSCTATWRLQFSLSPGVVVASWELIYITMAGGCLFAGL